MTPEDRAFVTALFDAAVQAANPMQVLRAHLPQRPTGRVVVIGAGKGVAQLAAAFATLWTGPLEGVVVTRYGYGCPTQRWGLNIPSRNEAGLAASAALFAAVRGLGPDDLVVALICGGGSALRPCPPAGKARAEEAALNRALLASGAPISVMNAVRKQVSGIKGGCLAAACHPARVVSLVVSDVPGDASAQVASGPTGPDGVTRGEARAMAQTSHIDLPPKIVAWLAGDAGLAPKPGDPVFAGHEVRVIASARLSLEAAATRAEASGIPAVILSDAIEGEARDIGRMHAAIVHEVALRGRPVPRPVVILSGGETTVTLTWQRARRPQLRIPAGIDAGGRGRVLGGSCCRHGRHRWQRNQGRGLCGRCLDDALAAGRCQP